MAHYINLGNEAFASARADEYIDKTGLIAFINGTLFTESRFSCISRCRRFGKSMAAKMLCAYYDKSCDSRELFRGLEIENHPDFEKHLNKYSVIYIDMTNYISDHGHDNDIVARLQREVKDDVIKAYPDVTLTDNTRLMDVLIDIALATGDRFVVIIDEWDAICREFSPSEKAMDEYVRLLRRMFKSIDAMGVFAAVYMTGILPMKRYETQSALNNFWEYSMIQPGPLASFFGFTREEVKVLCDKHGMAFEDMVKWYDGYNIGRQASMFNPSSVMKALKLQEYGNFWAATGAFDAVARYIKMDFDGLRKSIVQMLGGIPCKVDTSSFSNDPHIIRDRDEVLTLLIHLGYLAYNYYEHECYIPNMEVAEEMKNAVKLNGWREVMNAIRASEELLDSILDADEDAVANGIQQVHEDSVSVLKYNNENSLSCVMNLALFSARAKYRIVRELPTGKGFADLVLIPWRNVNLPAIVIELKWKHDAQTAITQIRERNYPASLASYSGELILCGVSYDTQTKKHQCRIERLSTGNAS